MIRIAIVENIAEQKQTPSAQKGVIEYCMHDSRQYVSDLLKEDELDLRSVQKQLRYAELERRQQGREQNQPRQRKLRGQDYER